MNREKHCKVRIWGCDTDLDKCIQKFEEYTEKFKLNEEGEIVDE